MVFILFFLAVFVGLLMGVLGAGGAILTTPIFVYLLNWGTEESILATLIIVSILSCIGTTYAILKKEIDWNSVFVFGIPSVISVVLTKLLVIPQFPQVIYLTNSFGIRKDNLLLLVFSIVLFLISVSSLISKRTSDIVKINPILIGLLVGFLTSLLGVGGGFLLIPALSILLKLNIKLAIGTSLFIIFLNSSISVILSDSKVTNFLTMNFYLFILGSITGLIIGFYLRNKITADNLKLYFYRFTLVLSLVIFTYEIISIRY